MELVLIPLHRHLENLDECAAILNAEWPRSKAARIYSLEKSCDNLPCSLILLLNNKVIGHSRILQVHGIQNACLIESVVVDKSLRGKGYGRKLMELTEDYVKGLGFNTVFLSTVDKQEFYEHLGYQLSSPVLTLGANAHRLSDNFIKKIMGVSLEETSLPDRCEKSARNDTTTSTQPVTTPHVPSPPPPPPPPPPPQITGDKKDEKPKLRIGGYKEYLVTLFSLLRLNGDCSSAE